MKDIYMRLLFIIVLITPFTMSSAQMIEFSDIHDTIDAELSKFLEDEGYGKVTYYYDNENEIDGKWQFYPVIKFSESISAIWVSSIPNNKTGYNYLLLYNNKSSQITETLGPFYDTVIDALKIKTNDGKVKRIKIRFHNPPEPFEPRYTFVQYRRSKDELVRTKTYNRK